MWFSLIDKSEILHRLSKFSSFFKLFSFSYFIVDPLRGDSGSEHSSVSLHAVTEPLRNSPAEFPPKLFHYPSSTKWERFFKPVSNLVIDAKGLRNSDSPFQNPS